MAIEWPKFKVFAVKDGGAYGLLVKRQISVDQPEEERYFWFRDGEGLAPTLEIIQACDQCHELYHSVYEKRLIKELVNYASTVGQTGNQRPVKSIGGKYYDTKGYQGLVDHFFERVDSQLRDFFVDADTFKVAVLAKIRGQEKIVGRAVEFGVLSPHSVTISGLDYVKPIDVVLEVGSNEQPQWFRKRGPIAVDFDDNRIYRRTKLMEDLKKLVLNNSFSMLEGIGATGKTTIVRQFGYELRKEEQVAVYHFDCDLDRDFDKNKLIKEINSTKGVIILENIHLKTQRYQRVYACIEPDPNRHVLFTTRPSFRERETKKDRLLSVVKKIELKPFDEVDAIIEHYSSHYPELSWSEKVRKSIKDVSKESFWLLAYALKGYVDSQGKDEPKTWLEGGVRDDLEELEKLEPSFPEVLVALSPLYLNEVLTDETYLTTVLGFDQRVLNELVYCGEITKQKIHNQHVFYGLPHSALASAYWEYGKTYRKRRKLQEYEKFIYKYAVSSDVRNGLEAVVKIGEDTRERLFERLTYENEMKTVIKAEHSMEAIEDWLWIVYEGFTCCEITDDILAVLAEKIHDHIGLGDADDSCGGIFELCYLLQDFYEHFPGTTRICAHTQAAERLWDLLDHQKLANQLSRRKDVHNATDFIVSSIGFLGKREFCALLNLDEIASNLREAKRVLDICLLVWSIYQANDEVGKRLLRLLDIKQLAEKSNRPENILYAGACIDIICEIDQKASLEFSQFMDLRSLAKTLSRRASEFLFDVVNCISSSSTLSREVFNLLYFGRLANGLIRSRNVDGIEKLIACIYEVNPNVAGIFCEALDIERLANNFCGTVYVGDMERCISTIDLANRNVGVKLRQLWQRKCLEKQQEREKPGGTR